MKQIIIVGPSKKQREINPLNIVNINSNQMKMAKNIFSIIKPLNIEETKELYKISDKLAVKVWEKHQEHGKNRYHAIEMYDGTVFNQLNIEEYDREWLNEHVRIIDPLYGIIKPFDTIAPYRLDFTIKFPINLKEYWSELVNNELKGYEIINLCSKEYSSIVKHKMLTPKLEDGKTIKIRRGRTLDKIIKNKGL